MAGRMMKAAQFEKGCKAEELGVGDVPVLTLQYGEILLKIHSSAINRADTLQVLFINSILFSQQPLKQEIGKLTV